jgi:ribosome-associated protein
MTTITTTADKKDVQKLQRAIVDGLEDVKALDIQVFNTEHLSPLFERVMIASGTSNRQTKALASSVRDAVRDAGFPKPRMEGEENGEWIIVDCGQAVVHIMQPAIRQYYHLEDLWGDKPVRLKFGAAKPALPTKQPVRQAVQPAAKTGGLKRSSAAKQGVELAYPSKAQEKRNAAQKVAAKKVAEKKAAPRKTPAKTAIKTTAPKSAAKLVTKAPAKAAAKTRKRSD